MPLPTVDPNAVTNPPTQGTATAGALSGGTNPAVELPRAQVINYPRFDLGFDLEKRGPSGIKRVDVWVTRDEGKSWRKWHERDGKSGVVRVELDVRENTQLEGNYGFRLVPESGAGFSEGAPTPGDTPDMRMVLDVTAPDVKIYPAQADKNAPDTLIIKWIATDRNFGDDPNTLEWG
jgi:hypothetical protein